MTTPRLSWKAFAAELREVGQSLRARIDASVDAFPIDEAARAVRRQAALDARTGLAFFARTYFPHYITRPPSRLHRHLHQALPLMLDTDARPDRPGHRKVIIAPRGSAKSTLVSQIFVIWCAIRRAKRFMIVIMDAWDQAALMVEAIKVELEANPRLAADFPEIAGAGRRWREGEIITRTDCMILGAGSGQKLRGRRFGPFRPDLVICDDIENDENVESPKQRDKLDGWIERSVIPLGPADGSMDFVMLGTVLHHDAVILRLSERPGYEADRFRALMRLPDRLDLWERWGECLVNGDEAAAEAFLAANRAAMAAGADLNWPEVETLPALMRMRALSPDAFASEKQGEPTASDSPFKTLHFWTARVPDLVLFGAVDPSLGKAGGRRDPSAILIGGYDRRTGILDVVEASIRRRLPDVIIADMIALARLWQPALWFVEAVQFQEFLRTEAMARAAREGVALPAVPIMPIADKRLRIERLQPPTAAGLIRFAPGQTTLLEQLRRYPQADHDDGPDALEMLWSGALAHGGGIASGDILTGPASGSGSFLKGYRL